MNARVTVGIPVYNCEKYLPDAIRSVFAQTFASWQLLLLDDGSADRSFEIARSIRDPRVAAISDGANRRLSYRLNQLAWMAQTEYLARMDADDLMHPDRLATQLRFLDEHPKIDVVSSDAYTIDSNNRPIGLRVPRLRRVSPCAVMSPSFIIHPTVVARTSWFRENPYWEGYERSEDRELWCRAFAQQRAKFARLAQPLLFYREMGAGAAQKVLNSHRNELRTIRRHGPSLVGRRATALYIASVFVKSAVWRLSSWAGAEGALSRLRSRALTDRELREAAGVIARILWQPVPGLDDGGQQARGVNADAA